MWDWKYSWIFPTFSLNVGNIQQYYVEYCQSHVTFFMDMNNVIEGSAFNQRSHNLDIITYI